MTKDIERPKETARKKAERKWANNDLRRRFKEAKQANAEEMEPPKTTVVTVVNPHFDEQIEFQKLVEESRRKFLAHMRKLVNEAGSKGSRNINSPLRRKSADC
jgi:RNase P protein component